MDEYVLMIDVRAGRTIVTVYANEPNGWLTKLWRDDRLYAAPPAVVTQVLCGCLVAISGRSDRAQVTQDLWELTSDLW